MKLFPSSADDPTTVLDAGQRTLYAVGKLVIDNRQRVCTVRNVSKGGVGIELDQPPPAGTMLEFEMRGLRPTLAEVRWVDGTQAGLALQDSAGIDDVEISSLTMRSPRFRFACEVMLRSAAGEAPARSIDVALGGMKLAAPLFAPPGTPIVVTVDEELALRGRVCWHLPHAFGVRFAVPLSPRQLATMLDRSALMEGTQ